MISPKRVPKSYKVLDSVYEKAKKKCPKPLATFLEDVVTAVSEDKRIFFEGELVHSPKIKSKQ